MNLTMRSILLADEPFLWEMLYQALYVPEGHPPFPREIVQQPEISQYVRAWGQPDDVGLIACDDETLIGAVWIRRLRAYGFVDDNTPELSIAMLPEYRGQGIGTRLMTELFALLQGRYAALSLSVSKENPALRLYMRLGFEVVKDDGNSVTMKRLLI
ncbi:MAG TPA: GNAT family N-acetyltransferase [Blastocatellia bacterium]|nr:GNAT family N-acetyltransferase [Blastocatellia bacterium]